MMKRITSILAGIFLLLAGCQEKEPAYTPTPVIQISFDKFDGENLYVTVKSLNTDAVYAMACGKDDPAPSAEEIASKGFLETDGRIAIAGLKQNNPSLIAL